MNLLSLGTETSTLKPSLSTLTARGILLKKWKSRNLSTLVVATQSPPTTVVSQSTVLAQSNCTAMAQQTTKQSTVMARQSAKTSWNISSNKNLITKLSKNDELFCLTTKRRSAQSIPKVYLIFIKKKFLFSQIRLIINRYEQFTLRLVCTVHTCSQCIVKSLAIANFFYSVNATAKLLRVVGSIVVRIPIATLWPSRDSIFSFDTVWRIIVGVIWTSVL